MNKYRIVAYPVGYIVEIERRSWFGFGKPKWTRVSNFLNPFRTPKEAEDWLHRRIKGNVPFVVKELVL